MFAIQRSPGPSSKRKSCAKRWRKTKTSFRGAKAERFAQSILEKEGYLVHRATTTGRTWWRKSGATNDIFGVFDLHAIRALEPMARYIQVTTQAGRYVRRKKIETIRHYFEDAPLVETHRTAEVWSFKARRRGAMRELIFVREWLSPSTGQWAKTEAIVNPSTLSLERKA